MKIYQVGGSVRDGLLGREVQDRDWVVVGSTPAAMLALGYRQVGADFPVFLHAETGQEYALARTERKSGSGYLGFDVRTQDVTLEEDLMRRDLTINAMALDESGNLIDPYGGAADLERKVLRHVGPAFAEDPVRILRILRFLARFGPEWSIHPDTVALVRSMVAAGEASHLVPERIWKETERSLMEPHPHLFVQGLFEFGLTALPCFRAYAAAMPGRLGALSRAATEGAGAEARFAVAFAAAGADLDAPGIPTQFQVVARLWAELSRQADWLLMPQEHAEAVQGYLLRSQVFKTPQTLASVLEAARAWGLPTTTFAAAVARAVAVDTKAISRSMPPGPAVGEAVRQARMAALRAGS